MSDRSKLRWAELPRRSLIEGVACADGGVRIMLLMSNRDRPDGPAADQSRMRAPTDDRAASEPR